MRNLFLLLWKNNFLILFLLLQGVSVYFIADQQKFHRASLLNSSNATVARVMETVNQVKEYLSLRENNLLLATQNANLLALDSNSFYSNIVVRDSINDTLYKQQFTYMVAHVINNSVNKRNNYLTLDKGFSNGVHEDMGVISAGGIVGVVKDVSEHYATVQSILHKEMKPSAKLKNSDFFGYITWDGSNPKFATLNEIPANVQTAVGDTVVTTSFSPLFPQGIFVGIVSKVVDKPAGDAHIITVKLGTNFTNLSYVYVVTNRFKTEQESLEQETIAKDKKNGN